MVDLLPSALRQVLLALIEGEQEVLLLLLLSYHQHHPLKDCSAAILVVAADGPPEFGAHESKSSR
jgi:hypothetical protein